MQLLTQKPLVMSQTWPNCLESFFGALKIAFVFPGVHINILGPRAS
jgi:hypothetical protein